MEVEAEAKEHDGVHGWNYLLYMNAIGLAFSNKLRIDVNQWVGRMTCTLTHEQQHIVKNLTR